MHDQTKRLGHDHPIATPTQMVQLNRPNFTRLSLYTRLASSILDGTHNVEEVANLLVDVRFIEIPQAFADAIVDASKGSSVHGLEERFSHLVQYVAFVAFGTTERNAIPSWFLQNYECFLAAMVHRLLVVFTANWHIGCLRSKSSESVKSQASRAFEMALALTAGAKSYLSLDCLAQSSGAHAILTVCNHSRYQFLSLSTPLPPIYCLFMDVLAKEILRTAKAMDAVDATTAFGYFASTRLWRTFAQNCIQRTELNLEAVAQLERDVTAASSRKRKSSPTGPTNSPTPPSSPTRSPTTPIRPSLLLTPPVKRPAARPPSRVVCSLKTVSMPFLEYSERKGMS
jgi:hypothetical protein